MEGLCPADACWPGTSFCRHSTGSSWAKCCSCTARVILAACAAHNLISQCERAARKNRTHNSAHVHSHALTPQTRELTCRRSGRRQSRGSPQADRCTLHTQSRRALPAQCAQDTHIPQHTCTLTPDIPQQQASSPAEGVAAGGHAAVLRRVAAYAAHELVAHCKRAALSGGSCWLLRASLRGRVHDHVGMVHGLQTWR